ncbi:MAG: hypothetical protein IPM04_14785 [Saprospiraceae bacterium]|nr:hypothetical protein [Candidatus Brachybacter algidus]MBK8749035.1 hypothetical protein [Candidatus Brachybacter algidus]
MRHTIATGSLPGRNWCYFLAMKGALSNAYLIQPTLNWGMFAQGLPLLINDLAESIAIKNVLGATTIVRNEQTFYHYTLAASGVISSALRIGCMQQDFIFLI